MSVAATRQFLVTIQGIDGTFASKTGGDKTAEASRAYNGGSNRPAIVSSVPEVSDITVGRPYDPERDQAVILALLPLVGEWVTTVTVTPLRGNLARANAKPLVYSECLLIGVTPPEHEAGGGDPAMLEISFAPADVS